MKHLTKSQKTKITKTYLYFIYHFSCCFKFPLFVTDPKTNKDYRSCFIPFAFRTSVAPFDSFPSFVSYNTLYSECYTIYDLYNFYLEHSDVIEKFNIKYVSEVKFKQTFNRLFPYEL